jgi:probable O-glycosylation ligase (exosortase A-associated)
MSIRDLALFALVFGSVPLILARPYIGVLLWTVFAFLNPHRFAWGAAYDFRFSLVIGATLVIATLFSRNRGRMIWTPVTCLWLVFFCWTVLTTAFALEPIDADVEWSRWWKINLVCVLSILLMQSRERLNQLIWTIVLSLGFYGVKGGLFTIANGGSLHVYGPPGSFLEENNGMALALILVIPLMRYLHLEAQRPWVKYGLVAAMVLTLFAILGSQSRGGFLGLLAMGIVLVWKSPRRVGVLAAALVLIPVLIAFMPSSWHDRMGTIQNYEQDSSAQGRINAWWFAFRLAEARPLVGGGFNTFSERLFELYAPNPIDVHDAHSIYFQVLGEQGFVGLALFLLVGFAALASCRKVARLTAGRADLAWAKNLTAMLSVSLVGYAVSGAFLGLAYFDLIWNLILITVLTRVLVERSLAVPEPTPAIVKARGRELAPTRASGKLGSATPSDSTGRV